MKVLVIGSGGREHAILWALKRTSRQPLELYCAPGNGGISELAECVPISVDDHDALMKFARDERDRPDDSRPGRPAGGRHR